ncbi:MAG: 2,3,4,5-tetrahydropyridine-2,6-dicarboxylate N-succinyltransferase, partial [Chlorobiaceae bacterium]|nr:2,3,4,5-tetrahydropyridine-2,6-dicarboxylate N-succinyltransferase [Chlorobiaceae bacterium]
MAAYDSLKQDILGFSSIGAAELREITAAWNVFAEFKRLLNAGLIRAAGKTGEEWTVNSWVKQGILLGMRLGNLQEYHVQPDAPVTGFSYIDKETYPLKAITIENNVRIVPGGSSVRDGAYLAPTVVMMPPAYVNVGAYVDEGTMIDSHALVGSCAQVGRKVHLSAAVQVGGVLEPVGAMPVIIEDEVMVGGNCGIYEGTIVRERAVIGTGVILNGST